MHVCVQAVKDDISQLIESQQELQASYENAVERKTKIGGAGDASSVEVQSAAADLHNNAAVFALALKMHPFSTDNLDKVQSDRFVSKIKVVCCDLIS